MDRYVLGLDLSMTSTGVALVHEEGDVYTHAVKSVAPKLPKGVQPTVNQVADRLMLIERQVLDWAFDGWDADALTVCALAVIEAPSFGSKGGKEHERGGLWWGIAGVLSELDIPIAKVAPKTREVYATGLANGKGPEGKRRVYAAAKETYADVIAQPFSCDDEADAVLLGAMGARWLGFPVDRSLPETHTRAMGSVEWPT